MIKRGPKVARKTTARGPQGLPTQAASTQKRTVKVKAARPAPVRQPGPISNAERKVIKRAVAKPSYQRQLKKTATEHAAAQVAAGADVTDHLLPKPKHHDSILDRARKAAVAVTPLGAGEFVRTQVPKIIPGEAGKIARQIAAQVDKEASGSGVLAKTLAKAGKNLGKNSTVLATGPQPIASKAAGGRPIASVRPVKAPPIVGRALEDMVNFPAQAVPSVYVPVAGVTEALQGNPQRLHQFTRDVKKSDPLYNLATGHPKKALKLANEHPGFTALELSGLKGTVGRGLGRGMRAVPGPTRALASTERAPKTFPGTNLQEPREYSPDVTRKARQVAVDKAKTKRAVKLRGKAQRAKTPEQQTLLRDKANRADPHRMTGNEVRRRMNERVGVNETVRRQNRTIATNEAKDAIENRGVRKARAKPSAATVLATQNIAKASREDLIAYRDEIAQHADSLDGSRLLANRQLRVDIDKALKNPKALANVQQAAERYAEQVARPRQAKLAARGMLAKDQADRSALIPYAVRHMGAKHEEAHFIGGDGERLTAQEVRDIREHHGDEMVRSLVTPVEARMVAADGKPLATAAIRAHMKAHGFKEPAYVTQAPGQRGARNFYVSSHQAPRIGTAVRTGEATRQGLMDAHPDTLIEGAARAQGLIDAADGFTATVKEFAHTKPDGKVHAFATKQQADQAARDMAAKDGVHMRPIRLNPWGGRHEQLKALLDKADGGALDDKAHGQQPIKDALEAAVKGDDGPGPWALIPEAAADQLQQHLAKLTVGPKGKALQLGSSAFRQTVLSTSPTWLVGNATEAGLRAAIVKAGPRSYLTGKRAIRSLAKQDPGAAQELSARALGGGHYSMADRVHVRRDASQFEGGRILEPTARALGAFWRAPGPKQLAKVWHGYTDIVFRQLNGKFESQIQTAMFGKALRDSPLMDGQTLKLSQKAIDEAARGLRNTNTQAQFGRTVERMYGKYGAFSPDMRGMIAMYTPFIAWTLNAVKFVYDVLPRDHPTVTGLIAMTEQATADWRKDHGLDLFIKSRLPGFLQGSVPTVGGGHQRFPNRYTPFGAFGDPLGTAAGVVLPQASGVLSAFKGQDWKGAKLRHSDGGPPDVFDEAKAAAASLVESTVPVYATAKRVVEGGPAALNPAKIVKPKAKKTATRKKDVSSQLSGGTSSSVTKQLNGGASSSVTDQLLK